MSSPVSAAQVFRLSPPQRRVWSLAGAGDAGDAGDIGPYRALVRLRLDGPLDPRALEAALSDVAARHEILRTTFPLPEGMSVPGQAVHDEPAPLRLAVREGAAPETLWEELAACPFRPDREPPLAASLAVPQPGSHVLVLAVHALCADEASLGVLVRDLRRAYAARAAGRIDQEEPPVQYADVAAALDEMLESEESEAGRAWWREILPAAPSLENLPFEQDAGPGGPASFEPRWVEASIDTFPSPAVLLAAWQALLARLSGGTQQVTGYELAGRHYEGFETAVGPFARAVPIRAAVRPGERFADLAARLGEEVAAVQDWQDYFSWEKEDAFFPTVFRVAGDDGDAGEAGGVRFRVERTWACTDRFRLRLTVRGAVAELAYDAARFRERDARTLLASWLALLASATATPALAIADLELVGTEDRRRLLTEWNATARPFEPVPVHDLFFAQAQRTPEAVAVSSVAGEALTYRELAQRVEGLAGTLRRAGVGPDVPVALYVEASIEMVVGVLAILAAGGAYVPLDPSYPPARLALVLEGSGAPVVLTRRAWADRLPGRTAARVVAVEDWQAVEPAGAAAPSSAEAAAYILFTSGSTGTPKGVVVRHRALTNHMLWMQEAYPLAPGDRVLQKTPLGFDASVWEVFAPLLAGAQLVVAEPETYRDPARLARVLAESGGTVLQVVPSLLRLLLGEEPFAASSSLRRLFCGGEPLSAGLSDRVHALLPGVDLINLYGPTETTVQVVTWLAERDGTGGPGESVPIGRPIHNARIYLLDAGMRLVPPGLPGELWIGGEPPARGYLGRPDLTASSFRPDPFAAEPGARLYRSGDLARYRDGYGDDGALVFLGRAGREVKIRGYRFDPGEIEDLLGREPGVREAAVVVREDALVAYVAPGAADPAGLRARLAEHLPSFLVPSAFVPLPALPRTPSGKLDRAALPDAVSAEGGAGMPADSGFAAPRTAAEQVLAQIWADLLGRERVGLHDDFFELGGHSLLGAQLVARVRQALGVELSLRTVFETPTVAGLAAQVAVAWDVPVAPPVERVPREGDEGEIPLSFAQQRLWFLDRLAPGHPAYNGFTAARFTGRLDGRALLAALREIVRVQESLRTTFPDVDGHPVQRPSPFLEIGLPVADLTALPEPIRLPEALRLAHEEARRPFDLAAGPLLRLTLLRLGEDESLLCTALHHIVSDAWSIGILYRDLMALYAAAAEGRPAMLPEPPVQYVDYAVWQRRWFEQVRERELAWWRERLADLPTLRLPADRPRPSGANADANAAPAEQGITLPVALSAELSERLRRLARAESATPFMVLLAGFQALLARWSGQDEVVVGVPVANRERAEVEGLVGFFVNTLVLPTSCAGDPTGRELLGRVRETALGAFAHQAMPFEVLVEELAPERDGLQPLFQVMFQLQTVPVPRFSLPGATVEVLDVDPGAAPFDLVLDLRETPEGVAGALQASRVLFDPTTLVRLLGHFRALLEGLSSDPGMRVAELPLLSPAERHQIAVEWNDTERPYERDRCIHELFAAQAARTPGAEALSFTDGRLTYAELEERSNRLARHLLLRGAGPEARVALRMESSAGFYVALLAILKTGAAYMPLDPTWPDPRVDLLLQEAGAALLLTPADLEVDDIARQSPEPLPALPGGAARAFPESLAYVVFTSGSTGRPKGVAVPHRAVVRMVRSAEAVPISPEDRVAQVSNVTFDGQVYEVWGALLHGACLVGLPREVMLDLRALGEYLRRERISFFLGTAALVHQAAREDPTLFQTVRRLSSGGEAFDARGARELLRAGGMGELFNDYGPTETTCFILVEKVTQVAAGARIVPIGRPIGNSLAAVLDRGLAPVPIGAPGELCLGGEGLARGYLGQPALTAERFVPDPVGPVANGIPGTRLYRTGDRVRQLPDGRIDFLGRFDDQVKVRGFRIEPGEIEAALAAHPAVAAAVVLPREEEGSRALVAYVVPAAGAPEDLDVTVLRAFLRQRLPEFLVPAFFVAIPALPVNRNGKVDRQALARIAPTGPAGSGSRPPRGALEETIAAVWAAALGTPGGTGGIGAQDRFFDLGGHSLLALRVLARMRDVLGLEVPLRVFFEAPTVEGIAAWIAAERGQAVAAAPPVVPVPRDLPLPLSFTQERLWLVDRLYPGTPLYNVPAVLRLRGPLAAPALAAALTEIVRRHEALRTRYATQEDGAPVQIVEPAREIALPLADLSALPEEPRLAEAGRLAWEESVRPFDLQSAPVLRALLLRLGEDDHVAALTSHHIVSDGWSQGLLAREVGILYEAFAAGRPSPLPPLPVQYADFAVWQRRHLRDDVLAAQLAWWRERLAGAPPVLELPADRPRPRLQSFAGEVRAATWAPPFVESLRELARREGGTLFLVLLAAFEALVTRLTGREDVVVGSPIANRPRPELEELIGFFANTLVLRTDLSGDPPFREAVARVRETSLGAWERQDVPFERLVEELRPQRDPSHPPIFQVMFVHHGEVTAAQSGLGDPRIPGLQVEPFGGSRAVSRYDLEVYALESAEGLFLAFEYSTALFDAGRIVRLLGQMETLLQGALADPGRRLSELPLLSAEETREVLAGWSDEPAGAEGILLHQLVEEQAARTPDAVALIAGEERWTYAELDRRAGEIAADLRRRGVGMDDRVAVSLPRTPEMIAAMLGVLKAGAAYVPVDPALPAARRARILEDAAAVWVIDSEGLEANVVPIADSEPNSEAQPPPGVVTPGYTIAPPERGCELPGARGTPPDGGPKGRHGVTPPGRGLGWPPPPSPTSSTPPARPAPPRASRSRTPAPWPWSAGRARSTRGRTCPASSPPPRPASTSRSSRSSCPWPTAGRSSSPRTSWSCRGCRRRAR